MNLPHQYIDRENNEVRTESLYGDKLVNLIYNHTREKMPFLFRSLTSARVSSLLGFINYDSLLAARIVNLERFMAENGVKPSECFDDPTTFRTTRQFFERKIRYWRVRPMPAEPEAVVAPADARVLFGSFSKDSLLFIKDKFFHYREMLGVDSGWLDAFADGSFAIFRLTPDKYHYNHTPVTGRVVDFYGLDGEYHSCNPGAVVRLVTPHSKNKRYVTIIDTDVPGGSGAGLVAMIEVVALMIGDVVQCYSRWEYGDPKEVERGLWVDRGCPKSLFRPGSSTTVLLFQAGRISFDEQLLANLYRKGVSSRFSSGFAKALVETDVKVRSLIGRALPPAPGGVV